MTGGFQHLRFEEHSLHVLDQTKLPGEEIWVVCPTVDAVAHAIRSMQVRGAPLIGVTAAFGMAIAAYQLHASGRDLKDGIHEAARVLAATRPTAVNLFWAIQRMLDRSKNISSETPGSEQVKMLEAEAQAIWEEDVAMCRAMGSFGGALLEDGETVMTHCNAGGLATGGYGSALGVVRGAIEQGKRITVIARETRPLLQGARLTAWELAADGIDVTVIPDSSAAHFMRTGKIDRIVVGADRIAANGDTANKIGTYDLALIAQAHGIPFHVAAPYSTVDFDVADGDGIPIEERAEEEIRELNGQLLVPPEAKVCNPAFDVTPAGYLTSIITDAGVATPPFSDSLRVVLKDRHQ